MLWAPLSRSRRNVSGAVRAGALCSSSGRIWNAAAIRRLSGALRTVTWPPLLKSTAAFAAPERGTLRSATSDEGGAAALWQNAGMAPASRKIALRLRSTSYTGFTGTYRSIRSTALSADREMPSLRATC
jgi:hypothetical protein